MADWNPASAVGTDSNRLGTLVNLQTRSCILQVNKCLSIKGAEDILNKPHAFELSTTDDSMFFVADTVKVCSFRLVPGMFMM